MKKIVCGLTVLSLLACCSGPSYFNNPRDFVGGNRAAALETHCARKAGAGKDNLIYKLCKQSFNNHYRD